MEQANWLILPLAALVPVILGYIWYHPRVMGTKLAKVTGESPERNRSLLNWALIYIFSYMLAYILTLISVHQIAAHQLFFMDPELSNAASEYNVFLDEFMAKYGDRHRSLGHGLFHGAETGLVFGLAFFGITNLIQNKPLKSIWIHVLFWIFCCSLMAGLISAFF